MSPRTAQKHTKGTFAGLNAFVCDAIILILNLAFYSLVAPTARAIELSVCRDYFLIHQPSKIGPAGSVEEKFCKADSIQQRLAWLLALNGILRFAIELVITLPYGFLADRYGKRIMLALNIGGQLASWVWLASICYFYRVFSTNLVLVGPFFTVIGGGSHLTTALVYGAVADTTKPVSRTARFSRLEAIIQMSQLVAPVIGSLLLSIDVFIPFIVAIPFAMLSLPLSAILPQMKDRPRSRRPCKAADEPPQDPEHGELPADREHQSEEDTLLGSDPDSLSSDERHREANTAYHQTSWREKFRIKLAHLHDDMSEYARLFYTNSIVRFASVAFLVTTFGHQSLHILIQYASKRFDVTIAEAGLLFTVKAIVVLVVFMLVLPSGKLVKSVPIQRTNIRFVKASIVLLASGSLLMGLAWGYWIIIPGVIVYAAGFGFSTLVRTLVTSTVPEEYIARLYSGLALAETVGSLTGSVALTASFTTSMKLGAVGMGLPYYICSGLYCLVALYVWSVDFEPVF